MNDDIIQPIKIDSKSQTVKEYLTTIDLGEKVNNAIVQTAALYYVGNSIIEFRLVLKDKVL